MITPTLFVACCARCRTISGMICSTAALIDRTACHRAKQLALLQRAAASLPVGERDHFLQSVAAHLSGQPTDDAVIAAINAALDAAAVAWRA
jgi:hypothetical protein